MLAPASLAVAPSGCDDPLVEVDAGGDAVVDSDDGDDLDVDEDAPLRLSGDSEPQLHPHHLCEFGAAEACAGDHEQRYCDWIDGIRQWGPCVVPSCEPGEERACEEGLGTRLCWLRDGVPAFEGCGFTPLALSLDPTRPFLIGGSSAAFTLDPSGSCRPQDWIDPSLAWLARDIDGSGRIENGRELFGSATVLDGGHRATDGFRAIAPLDGDGDGWLTAADPAFAELVLWRDVNGDGRDAPHELQGLSAAGVLAIELTPSGTPACDVQGTCVPLASRALRRGPWGVPTIVSVIDVVLPCGREPTG